MSETRRVHSIARKIGNYHIRRTLSVLLALDVILLVVILGSIAYTQERTVLGDDWQIDIPRRFEWEAPHTSILSAIYRFQAANGDWHSISLQSTAEHLLPGAMALSVFEIVILLGESRRAHRKARKLLQPIDQIVRDMQAVSHFRSDTARYEDRLRDLESAIDSLSPTHPDAQLRMGAEELTGLENAINSLLVRMHESYRQQAQFVSDASHELRTPISVIQGYARMLSRWGKDDPQVLEESIAAIQSESDYMKKLVEELLFLARGEIGRNPFDPAPLSLTALLQEVCEESAMIDPDHSWTFLGNDVLNITADANMLKQCARVLCENARKYTPKNGQITLRTGESEEAVFFSVSDEGIGIGANDLPRIFDRFYRSDPARDRNSGGSGLGLSIANWIVERHGGHFEVLSREGIGTRFTVHLPK